MAWPAGNAEAGVNRPLIQQHDVGECSSHLEISFHFVDLRVRTLLITNCDGYSTGAQGFRVKRD
jgi:hypothetical protein